MKALVRILLCLIAFPAAHAAAAPVNDTLQIVQQGCRDFRARLAARPDIMSGTAQVPKSWQPFDTETIPLFWWRRPGRDPSYPPLAFLHGGPASNSWAMLDRWRAVLENYPGDVVAFDHRGEGCSKTIGSNLAPELYEIYRIRNIVKDLEFLRRNIFQYRKWRIFGQSRGAALVHYYLEMAPDAIESAHAMGFAIMPGEMQKQYAYFRVLGHYRIALEYLKVYPGDDAIVARIREIVARENMCWTGFDDRRLCGPGVVDVLGVAFIKARTAWANLHNLLLTMVDSASIYAALDAQVKRDLNGHFHYIAATNSLDFGGPNSVMTEMMRTTGNPLYVDPFLNEIRYLGDAVAPTVTINWEGGIDPVNFRRIRRYLDRHSEVRFFLYAGFYDPVAPLETYQGEIDALGPRATLRVLPNSGHEGWDEASLLENVQRISY